MSEAGSTANPSGVWALLLGGGAAFALLAAFAMQYVGGHAPCNLCVLERYPYAAVIVAVGAGHALGRPRIGFLLAAVALAANVALSGYHVAVEEGWLALPESCTAVGEATTVEELKAQLMAAPPRCDQVALSWFGLSLAAWNGLHALVLLLVSLLALGRSRGPAARSPA